MSALATHYVQDSSGLVSMRTCCMMWIECSWTCFMLVDTAGSKAVMQTNKKSEIIPDVCVQITSTGSSLYRSTGAVLVSCLSLHSNCISTHASVCFILTVRAYHEEVTEPCKDGQRETERGEKRRTNRCFKPLADTFSICCSLSFFTPFFLNLLFIWCSTLSSSMSWYFMSSVCPNSWTCFDFCPPPLLIFYLASCYNTVAAEYNISAYLHLNVNLNCVGCWWCWYTQQLCVCVTDEGCELWKVNAAIFSSTSPQTNH